MRKISVNIKLVIMLLVGIIFSVVGVTAATLINGKEVTYDNTTSQLNSTNLQDAIDELYNKADTTEFKVGDYVSMTPTKTTFTIPMTLTGYTENQTINPSELNLWRVIRINDDKTIDMISEYVSSNDIYFKGMVGYQNYVGTLNYIAKQYENLKYTVNSRCMGYNQQTEYITDTSKLTLTTEPWTYTTSNTKVEDEVLGGGDRLFNTDIDLVTTAIGSLATKKVGTEIMTGYWTAGRIYYHDSSVRWRFNGTTVNADGVSDIALLRVYQSNNFTESDPTKAFRPIVTLKSNIKAEGLGTSESPYILN